MNPPACRRSDVGKLIIVEEKKFSFVRNELCRSSFICNMGYGVCIKCLQLNSWQLFHMNVVVFNVLGRDDKVWEKTGILQKLTIAFHN